VNATLAASRPEMADRAIVRKIGFMHVSYVVVLQVPSPGLPGVGKDVAGFSLHLLAGFLYTQ
jgi:hypothetical protein